MNSQLTTTTINTRLTGAAAVAGPILVLASTVAYVTVGGGLNEGELGGAIQVWAFAILGVAVLGLARTVERSVPGTAALLSVLAVVGAAVGGGYGIDSMQAAVNGTEALAHGSEPAVVLGLLLPGLLAPISLVVLGITLTRHGGAGIRGWLLVAAAVLFPVSRIPDVAAIAIVSDLLLVASMGSIGLQLLTGRDRSTHSSVPAPAAVSA
jgi:hypothetical protein